MTPSSSLPDFRAAAVPEPAPVADAAAPDAAEPAAEQRAAVSASVAGWAAQQVTPRNILLLGGLIVLGMTWALGGFRSSALAAADLPSAEAGTEVVASPLAVTLEPGRIVEEDAQLGLPDTPGSHYVLVPATLTTTDPRPMSALVLTGAFASDLEARVRFGAPAGDSAYEAGPEIVQVEDAASVSQLQSDLPQPAVLVWEQSDEVAGPAEVGITVHGYTWRSSILSEGEAYWDRTPAVQVHVPLVDERSGGGT